MNFWLIQRARIGNTGRKGLDGILELDYMGSAEFEFNSLPESLKRVRKDVNGQTLGDYDTDDLMICKGKVLTVFCKREQRQDVSDFLIACCRGKGPRLKELSELQQWAHPKTAKWTCRNNFWWDIDNDWFTWEKNAGFELAFIYVLQNPPPKI